MVDKKPEKNLTGIIFQTCLLCQSVVEQTVEQTIDGKTDTQSFNGVYCYVKSLLCQDNYQFFIQSRYLVCHTRVKPLYPVKNIK